MNKRILTAADGSWKWSRQVILLLLGSLTPALGWSQQAVPHAVSGRITSDNGEALAGVTVVLKGTDSGTITDADGRYTLTVSDIHSVLVVCAVGYTCREFPASRASINPNLLPETQVLHTKQVVGYGTQLKSQVTGAIITVGNEQLHDVPVANIGQALQGRAPGVSVANAGTVPGQIPVIRIRGNRSFLGGGDPLLVVDGVPFDGNLNDLNPDDIATVEVLRDAAATAIYGGRGANGILLLTTRRGRLGALHISYNGYAGLKSAYGRYDLQNGQQYYNYRLEAFRASDPSYNSNTANNFLTADERANYAASRTTDYQSLLFQRGHLQNHSLGLSGGTDQRQYSVSVGYYDETGIVPVQRFRRYSLRGTLDQQVGKRVKVGFSTLTASLRDDDPNVNVLYQILTTSPLASPTDTNGNLVLFPNGDQAGANPLTVYVPDAHSDQHRRLRSFNSLYGQVNILKDLDYRANVGVDVRSEKSNSFYAANTPQRGGGQSAASRSTNEVSNLLLENVLTYSRTLGRHYLHATGLYSWQQAHAENASVAATGVSGGVGGNPSPGAGSSQQWGLTSLMGRLHYAYADRYSATFTYRLDGSSRLSPGNKYSGFFGAAAAWNLAQEHFLAGHSWLSLLKLRASTGRVSDAVVNPYQTLGSLGPSLGGGYYNYGSTGAVGAVPSGIPNPSLGWESTTTLNSGLDFGFFQNRVTGSIDVYRQRTKDLLLPDALPSASGYGSFVHNGGQVQSRGVEIALTTVNVRAGNLGGFMWSTEWNFTVNREKVLDLGLRDANGNKISDIGNQRFLGQPLYVFYDYKKLGIWQTAEADQARRYGSKPGQIKVEDVDGNGMISPADRQIIGSRQPRFEAGLTNRFRFKGFDLNVVAMTRVGATVVDPVLFGPTYYTTFGGRRNQVNLPYWTPETPNNPYPQPNQAYFNDSAPYSQTLSYRDGTFIKVRSIDLGYTIPAAWAGALHLTSAHVYVQVQNPLIWTRDLYFRANKAIDPDALTYSTRFNAANPGGIEFTGGNPNSVGGLAGMGGNYPVTRTFLTGINLGF